MSEHPSPPRIALLPDELVNQIAAGEVIERPASVVKELLENSLDAGATRIEVEVEDGGMTRITVRDNGGGIHPEDMELAILRHSTSKIRSLSDLASVLSLGFRGEALSSIASVSDFRISSRTALAGHGWRLEFDPYSRRSSLSPAPHPAGTTVEVYELFKPVPARRKFLRSDRTEFLHVLETVRRLAMGRHDVGVSLAHNGRIMLNCPAENPDCRRRLQAIMGGGFSDRAFRINSRAGGMHLHGWLGGGLAARSQSDRQYLYLNGRVIRDRRLNHAIRLAVDEIIATARYPSYVLHLELDPVTADVNVHPTKQEVRFRHPRNVHDFIHAALRDGIQAGAPQLAGLAIREEAGGGEVPGFGLAAPAARRYPYAVHAPARAVPAPPAAPCPWGNPVAFVAERYLLCVQGDELNVLDYSDLKRRYLLECFRVELAGGAVRERPLLVPVMQTLDPAQLDLLAAHGEMLARLGLRVEQAGPRSAALRAFPALLPEVDIKDLLEQVLQRLQDKTGLSDRPEEDLLRLMAEHGSLDLPADRPLQDVARDIARMSRGADPAWCALTSADLQKILDGNPRKN